LKGKIFRRIFGPIKSDGQWRTRYDKELCELDDDSCLSVYISFLAYQKTVSRKEACRGTQKKIGKWCMV
jgi:hypothetical protein